MSKIWNDKKTLVKISILVFIALVIIGYAFFQSRNIISGPQISLSSPVNGAVLDEPKVMIAGTAKNISFLTLNDRQIYMNESGTFNEELLLSPGYNIWTISAKDKFGRCIEKKIELVFRKS